MAEKKITISLNRDTQARIAKYGKFGDSFEDVIRRILDDYERSKRV